MRGEFIRADGLRIPNNITSHGAEMLLRRFFQGVEYMLHAGLANGVPAPDLTEGDLDEPTSAFGYGRIALALTDVDWPTLGTSNTERYIESKPLVFTAAGGDFDVPIQRVVLFVGPAVSLATPVFAISGLLPAEVIITPTTPEVERSFIYRLYL